MLLDDYRGIQTSLIIVSRTLINKTIFFLFFKQSTDAGILCDDIQRFERFSMAVSLITKSSSDAVTQEFSRQLESCLNTITTASRKLVSRTL